MRHVSLLAVFFFSSVIHIFGQTRIVTGKVINEYLETVGQARILNSDTVLLTTIDQNGQFKLELPVATKSLQIAGIGYEYLSISLTPDCQQLDIILMGNWHYDYINLKKVDKLRLKRFKKLSELHLTAFQKGIFTTDKACYSQSFITYVKKGK